MSLPVLFNSPGEQSLALSSIGDQIRASQACVEKYWFVAKSMSDEYCAALGMGTREIEALEDFKRHIVVSTKRHGKILLIPKKTCGCPYGDTWIHMLQARGKEGESTSFGNGTAFFSVLPEHLHEAVMEAIEGQTISVDEGSIWP